MSSWPFLFAAALAIWLLLKGPAAKTPLFVQIICRIAIVFFAYCGVLYLLKWDPFWKTTRAGWTQILFKRMLSGPERPDFYLFVATAEYTGRLDIESSCWKADPVQVVSVSENADQQEAMLLMPAYSWVHGELGTFYAEPSTRQFWSASLRLERAGLAE